MYNFIASVMRSLQRKIKELEQLKIRVLLLGDGREGAGAEGGKLLSRLEWPFNSLKTLFRDNSVTYPSISKAFHVQMNGTATFPTRHKL